MPSAVGAVLTCGRGPSLASSSHASMARTIRNLVAALSLVLTAGCSLMPRELNLTPLWFHRLDAEGELLEWDAAWPLLHYERTPEGGDDFRVRPLYRRVTQPVDELPADSSVEHQFLWPLGRVQSYPDQTHARVFPLFSYREAIGEAAQPPRSAADHTNSNGSYRMLRLYLRISF